MSGTKRLLFSVTAKDCVWQTMTAGGKGGQHEQKNQTAVRCIHKPSGAVAESREFKSQIQNKRSAFKKMAESRAFQLWARVQAAKLMGVKSPEEKVEEMMQPQNLKIEYQSEEGWSEDIRVDQQT